MRKRVTLKLFYLLAAVFIFIIPFTVSPMALYLVQVLIGFSLGHYFSFAAWNVDWVCSGRHESNIDGGVPGALCTRYFRRTFSRGIFNDWLGLRAGFYFAGVLGLAAVILAHMWGADAKKSPENAGRCGKVLPDLILFLCTLSKRRDLIRIKFIPIYVFSVKVSIRSTKYDKFPLFKMVKSDYLLSEKAAGNKS